MTVIIYKQLSTNYKVTAHGGQEGTLELTKCFYYLLSGKWDSKGNPIPESTADQIGEKNQVTISLNKESEQPVYLEKREVTCSHKTLGTLKCIVGIEDDHIKYFQKKSNNFAQMTISSQFNRRQSRRAFNSCYILAMA
jgi:hypothetical protein